MPYFALFYDTVDDYVARRAQFRAQHLEKAREAYARGELILAGALADPVDRALLVFRTPDQQAVEEFARHDPVRHPGARAKLGGPPVERRDRQRSGGAGTAATGAGRPMIARVWTARAASGQAAPYAAHLRGVVLPAIEQLAGYEGATVLQRQDGDDIEIVVMTWWRSLEDVRAFAGDEPVRAVVADAAQALLARFDREVRHFDVALDTRPSGSPGAPPR